MSTLIGKTCCGICDQEQERGFYLYQLFICEACEQKIVTTSPEDAEYAFFIEKLKNVTKAIAYS